MSELLISDRMVFKKKGIQKAFILGVKSKLNLTWGDLASQLNLNSRTITDWYREKFRMSLVTAKQMSKMTGISIPAYQTLRWSDHASKAGSYGGKVLVAKQGKVSVDEVYRKKKWREWWVKNGKFKSLIIRTLPFYIPPKSEKLAEFFGIMMGDGGLSNYQACITLHHVDDLEFSKFVIKLIKELFKVRPSIYHSPEKSVNNIVISRRELVKHLNSLGLPIGNKIKQKFDIPQWIKKNHLYQIACLRGLVDTDGCIFTHRYKVIDKIYTYKKIAFTTVSEPLRNSVYEILKNLGFNPRISNQDIRLESQKDVRNYFNLIGSHNPKHLKRYAKVG